jgi:hypothetical protein
MMRAEIDRLAAPCSIFCCSRFRQVDGNAKTATRYFAARRFLIDADANADAEAIDAQSASSDTKRE